MRPPSRETPRVSDYDTAIGAALLRAYFQRIKGPSHVQMLQLTFFEINLLRDHGMVHVNGVLTDQAMQLAADMLTFKTLAQSEDT